MFQCTGGSSLTEVGTKSWRVHPILKDNLFLCRLQNWEYGNYIAFANMECSLQAGDRALSTCRMYCSERISEYSKSGYLFATPSPRYPNPNEDRYSCVLTLSYVYAYACHVRLNKLILRKLDPPTCVRFIVCDLDL